MDVLWGNDITDGLGVIGVHVSGVLWESNGFLWYYYEIICMCTYGCWNVANLNKIHNDYILQQKVHEIRIYTKTLKSTRIFV